MSAKYTPGRWNVRKLSSEGAPILIKARDGLIVATIPWDNRLPRDANARLIAAVPQLVKALQSLVPKHDWGHLDPLICPTCVGFTAAHIALAEALGEEQE